jgi:hypothetical protein
MDEKERIDALMKQADFYMEHRKERRDVEWRISLAIWGFLAAGIGTVVAKEEVRTVITESSLTGGLLLAVPVVHGIWVLDNLARNERDARRAYECANHARELLKLRRLKPEWLLRLPIIPLVEWLITVGLVIVWAIIMKRTEPLLICFMMLYAAIIFSVGLSILKQPIGTHPS